MTAGTDTADSVSLNYALCYLTRNLADTSMLQPLPEHQSPFRLMFKTAHARVFATMHAEAELIVPCVFVLITEHVSSAWVS